MNARLPHVFSASQISTYELCERKWGWAKLDGIQVPPNKSAGLGLQVHQQLADWLLERKEPPVGDKAGDVARIILLHLPPPQAIDNGSVERKIILELDGLKFIGYVDLFDASSVTVYDHKTTVDLRWSKSEEDLISDVQATIYAEWAFQELAPPAVNLQWTYGTTKGQPKAKPVRLAVTKDQIAPRLAKTIATAREITMVLEQGLGTLDLPFNAAACDAFGGCPFRNNCNLKPEERMQSAMSQESAKNSFLAKMEANRARKAGQINPPPVEEVETAQDTASVSPAPPAQEMELPGKLRNKIRTLMAAIEVATPELVVEEPVRVPVEEVKAVTEAAVEAPSAPVKRGRPRKEIPTTQAVEGYTLYINCTPVKLPSGSVFPEYASDRIQRVLNAWRAESGQTHYKQVQYGEGPGLFASGVGRDLEVNPPVSGSVVLYTGSPEANDCLQVFIAHAHTVVQG